MKILTGAEQLLFDRPPQLSGIERRRVFELPFAVWSAANDLPSVSSKIGFLVSAGYFRSARRFFLTSDFYDHDIAYVAARLGIDASGFDRTMYSARNRQQPGRSCEVRRGHPSLRQRQEVQEVLPG